ncbi:MAG: hypothetical protein ACPGXY_02275 [Alphaproteobacteria bacterium]
MVLLVGFCSEAYGSNQDAFETYEECAEALSTQKNINIPLDGDLFMRLLKTDSAKLITWSSKASAQAIYGDVYQHRSGIMVNILLQACSQKKLKYIPTRRINEWAICHVGALEYQIASLK